MITQLALRKGNHLHRTVNKKSIQKLRQMKSTHYLQLVSLI